MEESKPNKQEKIVDKLIEEEMKQSYLDYSMSVIVGRALPDVRDGLKPVHRRILYAMNDMGMFHNKPFKKSARIVGECFVAGTLINSERGLVRIEDIKKGDKVYTQSCLKKVTQLYEMPKRPLLNIVLENGFNNVVTKSQKFKVLTKKFELVWKKASELKDDDYIVSRSVFPEIKKDVKLSDNKKLNENLAYLLGFFMSDGWIEKESGRIGFFSMSKGIIIKIQSILKKEFNYDTNITRKKCGDLEGHNLRINKIDIKRFLIRNFNLKGICACSKKIPEQILSSPKKVIFSFLSGLIDGDGSIHKTRNLIHYGSISQELIKNLQILLHSFGIPSQMYKSIESTHILNNREIKANYPFFSLEVSGKNCLELCQNLKLIERKKKEKLKVILKSLKKKNSSDNIPYASNHIFRELSQHHLGGGWYKNVGGKKFRLGIKYNKSCKIRYSKDLTDKKLGKEQILKLNILEKMKLIGSPIYGLLKEIIDKNLTFIKVNGIQESGSEKTYDIQVERYHEFIANGMVSHNCLGKYHPHGDTAVYDSMVRMTQDFSLRYILVQGQGNFGSIDGDSAAAMRYTEARLNKLAEEMLKDIDKNTVKFVPNFDNSLKEPSVLPSKIPNLLVNGSSGIAVGMATNIPPHNMTEVCEGIISTINNPDIEIKELFKIIKGPDFPTGGIICGRNTISQAYNTGRGKLIVRSKTEIIEIKGRRAIIIKEIPYMVNKAETIKEIAKLVNDKKIKGIFDIRDESDREGMRVVIELTKDANEEVVINQLFRNTRLQVTFGIIMLALVNNEPKILNLKQLIQEYIKHRQIIVRKRTEFDLKKAEERQHILSGLIIALNNIDPIVKEIKASKTVEDAKNSLMSNYKLTEIQAKAILDMKLQKLSSLEQQKIKQEYEELTKLIQELKKILADEKEILNIIKKELDEIKQAYGDKRKTSIIEEEYESFEEEELIKPEEDVITISHSGYIKRLPVKLYKQQKRGGKGVRAASTKEEDFIEEIFVANTHDYILFFTNKGKLHWLKVYQIPEAGRQAKGSSISNLLHLGENEKMSAFVPVKDFNKGYLMMATKNGIVKKTELKEFSNPRKGGIIAVSLKDDDELINVINTSGENQIILATRKGQAVRFKETDIRPMGRQASGVRGAKLKENDKIIGMVKADDSRTLLTITENGYGKRSYVKDYRLISRGGSGVRNIICSERNGKVVAVKSITDDDDLMFISKEGITIRTPAKDLRIIGRNTQGLKLMGLNKGDKVVAAAKIVHENGENTNTTQDDESTGNNS